MVGPFEEFIRTARPLLRLSIPRDLDDSELEAYAENIEEVRFASGMVLSLEMLNYAYVRLCELGTELKEAWENLTDENVEEVHERGERLQIEIETLTSFVFNETKSVVDMFRNWLHVSLQKNSEIHYLCKIRNFFVAHPNLRALMQAPHRITSIPASGPALRDFIGAGTYESYMLVYYSGKLGINLDEKERVKSAGEKAGQKNEEFIRNLPRNVPRELASKDLFCLKCFGVRMPDIQHAFEELNSILQSNALPAIKGLVRTGKRFQRNS